MTELGPTGRPWVYWLDDKELDTEPKDVHVLYRTSGFDGERLDRDTGRWVESMNAVSIVLGYDVYDIWSCGVFATAIPQERARRIASALGWPNAIPSDPDVDPS